MQSPWGPRYLSVAELLYVLKSLWQELGLSGKRSVKG